MREIRVCDEGNLEAAAKLCIEYHLGIEVQVFIDPYMEHREEKLKIG